MRAVTFGTYDIHKHPRVAVIIEGLREHGVDVVECNSPIRLDTAQRVAILQQPWRLPLLAVALLSSWGRLVVRSLRLHGRTRPDVVVVGYLGHFDVHLARLLFPRRPVVLDHLVSAAGTAKDRGQTGSGKQRLLRGIDRAALAAADVVVVDTQESLEQLPARSRAKAVVVPVGASSAWFAAPRDEAAAGVAAGGEPAGDSGPLRAVFFGLFTPLQGAPVIARAVAEVPSDLLALTLVGSGQDHEEVRRTLGGRDAVTWRSWVTTDELPAFVASHDVCLGIFGDTVKALSVVPTKVYQGAAAGCAVVTSDTDPQRRVLDGAALLVPPGDPQALAAALTSLARDRERLCALRAAARAAAREHFTSSAVVADLVHRLRGMLSPGPASS